MTLPNDLDGMTPRQRSAYVAYNAAIRALHAFEERNRDEYDRLKAAVGVALREFNLAIVGTE